MSKIGETESETHAAGEEEFMEAGDTCFSIDVSYTWIVSVYYFCKLIHGNCPHFQGFPL